MKSQDILLLLKVLSLEKSELDSVPDSEHGSQTSARNLAALTGVGKTEVNASLNRSIDVGLAKMSVRGKSLLINKKPLLEFIVHGIKYVFPVKPAEMTRGIPTAFAAPVLNKKLMSAGDLICVWPDASASDMGQAILPLYKTVPIAIKQDKQLYEYLALVDAIRIGRARESKIAITELSKRILN